MWPQIGGSDNEWITSSGITAFVSDSRGAGVVVGVGATPLPPATVAACVHSHTHCCD